MIDVRNHIFEEITFVDQVVTLQNTANLVPFILTHLPFTIKQGKIRTISWRLKNEKKKRVEIEPLHYGFEFLTGPILVAMGWIISLRIVKWVELMSKLPPQAVGGRI